MALSSDRHIFKIRHTEGYNTVVKKPIYGFYDEEFFFDPPVTRREARERIKLNMSIEIYSPTKHGVLKDE